jgi:hypothetical protein
MKLKRNDFKKNKKSESTRVNMSILDYETKIT